MNMPAALCPLPDLGILRLRGPDARRFLQGQLSNDLGRLTPGGVLRAGLHNAQGRTLALLALLALGEDDLGAVLPLELIPDVAALLRRYVLRSRVSISDESAGQRVYGLVAAMDGAVPDGAARLDATRCLWVQPAASVAPPGAEMAREQWRALDVAAGLPQVYRATSGQFVAQMLNLDCIDAISFSKGCYTGQEVIARAHYRGRVKRRLQRFAAPAAPALGAGDVVQLADGRAARVIEAVRRTDGGCEFLAVAALPGAEPDPAAAADGAEAAPADNTGALQLHPGAVQLNTSALPLPYPLPA
jgi:folate-binding protein YgfZ